MNTWSGASLVDLSRIPLPDIIEPLSYSLLFAGFQERFSLAWASARAIDASLPPYDVTLLETDPAMIVGQAWAYLRLLDRRRVNDVIAALLAPLAKGADLDNVVSRQGITRSVIREETSDSPELLESDASMLRRYFDSFERASAGSAARYLFEARSVWPQSEDRQFGLWDARVLGHAVHGRRGDTDIVIVGPFGRPATEEEIGLIRSAVTAEHVRPEAVAVTVMPARRVEYEVSLIIELPAGPDAELVRQEAVSRVTNAALSRLVIGGEIPPGYLASAAYGGSVIKVRDAAPVAIDPDPYGVPVMTGVTIVAESRT